MQLTEFSTLKLSVAVIGFAISQLANAHVSIANKIYSNSYSEIQLSVPHGCEGFDSVKVEVTLPEGLTGVRPFDSTFGPATIEKTEEVVTKITWTTSAPVPHASDSHAYNFAIRAKTPDAPFRTLFFPTVQTCKDLEGNTFIREWVGTEGHGDHDSSSEVDPAPSAMLFPVTTPGWHEFLTNEHIHDLSIFKDAEIVWFGAYAYSANPTTMKMIEDDPDVGVLELLHPGSQIWVKY